MTDYSKAIQKFDIIDKAGQRVPFVSNDFQARFIEQMTGRDVILKARQCGFSSLILALFTIDFLLKENSRSVCISHDAASAQRLFDRVKFYIQSAQDKGLAVDFKYNSRSEMVNKQKNSTFYIGQAGSKSFGRGDTLNNLHLSEFAFYPEPEALLASTLQAVVPGGRVIIESTANGMNFYKNFSDKAKAGQNNFKFHFFNNSFYSQEFLEEKRMELGEELFKQEYPTNDLEAFLSSGDTFFDKEALAWYLNQIKEPISTYQGYYDLSI